MSGQEAPRADWQGPGAPASKQLRNQIAFEEALESTINLIDQRLNDLNQRLSLLETHLEQQSQLQQQASKETQRLSRDTEPTADKPSTKPISSETYFLAREDTSGELQITVTGTSHGLNSIVTLGAVLKLLLEQGWILRYHDTLESQWPFGSTPSPTQEEAAAGRSAGGEDSDETTFAP